MKHPFLKSLHLFLFRVAAVSYTHLDVYKRQIVHIAPTFGADDDRVAKQQNIAPVSYTHIDVYKRQRITLPLSFDTTD